MTRRNRLKTRHRILKIFIRTDRLGDLALEIEKGAEENYPELEQWPGGGWGKPSGGEHQGRTVVL